MFTGTKYIVMSNCIMDEKIFIFSGTINHSDMVKVMKLGAAARLMAFDEVISAGFIDEFMQCYGESTTLNLKSREIDTILLKSMLNIDDKKLIFESDDDDMNKFGL